MLPRGRGREGITIWAVTGGNMEDQVQGPRRMMGPPSTCPPLMLPIVFINNGSISAHAPRPSSVVYTADANVQCLTVMATTMPFVGRG